MRKRNHVIPIRLNTKEMKHLETQVAVSGLNREEYLRTLILGAAGTRCQCNRNCQSGECQRNAEDIQKSLGRSKGNVVMTYCIYKYYSRSSPRPFCRLYPG
mgnify:CR=1 FL=1